MTTIKIKPKRMTIDKDTVMFEYVPRGKWLDHYYPMFDVPGIECSICSKEVRGWARHMPFPNFCPNCGADMREEASI